MVTTRSADKRVDAHDEDLVLRSRTIASPASQDSTPSRTRKRNNNHGDDATPITKRVRRLVSVEISLPRPAASVSSRSATQDDDDTIVVASNTSEDQRPDPADKASIDVAAESEPTPRQREVFQTPATSRHKRFDSSDPEDTIIVNRDVSSNSQQGYETAEEVIVDSDEAPEIQSTKVKSNQPQSAHSIRASRRRGRARASDFFSQPHEQKITSEEAVQGDKSPGAIDESTKVEVQVQEEPKIIGEVSPDTTQVPELESGDLETGATPDLEEYTVESVPSVKELRELEQEEEAMPVVEIAVSAALSKNELYTEAEITSTENAAGTLAGSALSVFENIVPPSHVGAQQEQRIVIPKNRLDSTLSLRPKSRSTKNRSLYQNAIARKYSFDIRLPDPPKTSRSRLVRHMLERRGVSLQSTWPTKRRAFVT